MGPAGAPPPPGFGFKSFQWALDGIGISGVGAATAIACASLARLSVQRCDGGGARGGKVGSLALSAMHAVLCPRCCLQTCPCSDAMAEAQEEDTPLKQKLDEFGTFLSKGGVYLMTGMVFVEHRSFWCPAWMVWATSPTVAPTPLAAPIRIVPGIQRHLCPVWAGQPAPLC